MTNPLQQLQSLGQSVWYDNIDRSQLASGQFKRMLSDDGIIGVTANPTIFEKSVSGGHAYDEQMDQLIRAGKVQTTYTRQWSSRISAPLRILLRPIYDRTNGQDGYVSLEVSPELAHDTEGTIKEARRF